MNTTATFQRMMDDLVIGMAFVKVCLDDMVAFSKIMADHITHMQKTIQLLSKNGMKLRLQKCEFAQSKIGFL